MNNKHSNTNISNRKLNPNRNEISQPRTSSSLGRQAGNRQPRRHVLIVCEGEKTEPNYFKLIKNKLRLSTIEIKQNFQGPVKIVEEARKLNSKKRNCDEPRDYDETWCVFDVENPSNNPNLGQAIALADENNINLAVSNPSFEYWYILHFSYTDREFADGSEAKEYLRQFIPNYSSGNSDFLEELYTHTYEAITNSKNIFESHAKWSSGRIIRFPNPSTYVYKLVEELLKISRES
jgi:hypothetical protein